MKHKCSEKGCQNTFEGYHGKVGCQCLECDNKTPEHLKRRPDETSTTKRSTTKF